MVPYSKTKSSNLIKLSLALVGILVVAAGAYGYVHVNNVRSEQKKSGVVANVQPPSDTTQGVSGSNGPNNSDAKIIGGTGGSEGANVALNKPTGNFVSNHFPGQNGTDTRMVSSCNTVPGAKCDVFFTSSTGVTKNLGEKTADGNGSVMWEWDISGANMAPGKWKVSAVTKLGDQTATNYDAINLEVQ